VVEPLALRLQRGASLVPSGDVITEVRNEQLGEVMRIADRYGLGELSIGEDSTMTLDRTIVMLIAGLVAGIGILTGALGARRTDRPLLLARRLEGSLLRVTP
jgi:hypothetical protein